MTDKLIDLVKKHACNMDKITNEFNLKWPKTDEKIQNRIVYLKMTHKHDK